MSVECNSSQIFFVARFAGVPFLCDESAYDSCASKVPNPLIRSSPIRQGWRVRLDASLPTSCRLITTAASVQAAAAAGTPILSSVLQRLTEMFKLQ